MLLVALVLLPAVAGFAAFALRAHHVRRVLLVAAAACHAALTAACWLSRPGVALGGWLTLDALGQLFLTITSGLFLVVAVYAIGYLRREGADPRRDFEEGTLFSDAPEARFVGCLLLFLSSMTLVTVSLHLGLLWVAIEATTLASAPLISFHRHHRSLEATWKYLLICSVGIALALLGNFFLAVAAARPGGESTSMFLPDLLAGAASFQPGWLKAAFILVLVGYGTKMGLAPLHTWLPDAHAEAPSVASALLSGALLNCAFLGILRGQQLLVGAGLGDFGRRLLLVLGLFSMAYAAAFVIGQADYKRMLAYSSVEHMGILALGVGIGGVATYGALLHAVNHSLVKGMLFLVAGNLLAVYKTRSAAGVSGALRIAPASAALWLIGLFAITGSPPFGTFLSELAILKGGLDAGRYLVAAAFLALLAAVFVGMGRVMVQMAQGSQAEATTAPKVESRTAIWPPVILAGAAALLGVWVPARLSDVLQAASRLLGAQ